MEEEMQKKIGVRMNKMLGEIRKAFKKCYLAKNLAKGRFEKLM